MEAEADQDAGQEYAERTVIRMKKIRLEMEVPEEVWRKCAVQAAEAGLTFEELVKRMVTDLGAYDQKCHAEAKSWMAACVSSTFSAPTFLKYLDSSFELEYVLGLHDAIQDHLYDLQDNDPMDQIDVRDGIAWLSSQLRDHYHHYRVWYGDECVDKTLAAGMARILAWRKKKWDLVKQQGAVRP